MKVFTFLLLCLLAACSPKRPAQAHREISGTLTERVAAISKIISQSEPLPGLLIDARLLEEQTGDGQFGSSDFAAYYTLSIASSEIPAWSAALRRIEASNTPPKYVAPKNSPGWWLSHSEFSKLTFYSPKSLTGRSNGWVGIAPDGKIYVYAFTM